MALLVGFTSARISKYILETVVQIAQVAWPIWKHWLGNLGNLDSNKETQP